MSGKDGSSVLKIDSMLSGTPSLREVNLENTDLSNLG
jgi:hypothetical protein